MNVSSRTLVCTAAIALLAGCSTPPEQDLATARDTFERARESRAEQFAPEAWDAASRAEASLQAELLVQEERSILVRNYSEAKRLAGETSRAARQAQDESEVAQQAVRKAVEGSIGEARTTLAEVRSGLEGAPSGKETTVDLASMKSETLSIETLLDEAESALDAGDYLDAKSKTQLALQSLDQIKAELDKARARRPARRA